MDNQDIHSDIDGAKSVVAHPLTRKAIESVRESASAEIIGSKDGVVIVVVR